MTHRVYKYPMRPIPTPNEWEVDLPALAKVLHINLQNNTPTIWAKVDIEEKETFKHHYTILGTGTNIPNNVGKYITTLFDGPFV